jgi:NitT/TauT family transport system ATP-binding protein
MLNNILELKNIRKIYHSKDGETLALDNLNLRVLNEEFISIIGPSGCGKSTLLGIVAGIVSKSGGDIIVPNDFKIGYMLQDDCLFPKRTVLENAVLGLEIKGLLNDESRKRVINLLTKYGLGDFINSYPDSLSGGMKQRVALIRTLALDPDLLLLDEPFSALDYQTRLTLSDDLYKIIKQERKTTIMVTHDIAEAISMSDRIVLLTKRPSTIKSIYDIILDKKDVPTRNRQDKNFIYYYNKIWKALDNHV